MEKIYYSIFNDALGPIMTGPSSSHCAGCNRIGQIARSLFGKEIKKADIVFEEKGSYPGTYIGQGSNFGFISGLLGYNTDDSRLKDAVEIAKKEGRKISFSKADLGFLHPNQAEIRIYDDDGKIDMTLMTFSVGGGMFKITKLDGFNVSIDGGRDQYFVYADKDSTDLIKSKLKKTKCSIETIDDTALVTVFADPEQPQKPLYDLKDCPGVKKIRYSKAVLPIIKNPTGKPPFFNAAEALKYADGKEAWKLALHYEIGYGNTTLDDIWKKIKHIKDVMEASSVSPNPDKTPLYGFLPYSSKKMGRKIKTASIIDTGILNKAMISAISVMENSCSHNIIVAAPTAGSSGVVPASVVTIGKELGKSDEEILKALLTSGLIGVFIANQATFAGEVGACQAEMGSAAAMAAGGLTYLLGGNLEQIFRASSMALQNMLGLICDPVAGLTEIPCISRNVSAMSNAVMSANMVMLGFNPVIPLDEVIETMNRVGKEIPADLRCTCGGGLCTTPTGCKIQKEMNKTRTTLK